MTQRMFVCHAKSDIEATSEIVDALESALEFPSGTVGTLVASSLPGYASDVHGEGELHAMLTGATLILALFTERSTYDPEFVFELGAAWALGIDVLPLLLGATSTSDVPWPLRDRPSLRAQDEAAWRELVQQLSHRLQVPLRQPQPAAALEPETAPVDVKGLLNEPQLAAADEELTAPAGEPHFAAPEPAPESEPEDQEPENQEPEDQEPERDNPVSIVAPVMVHGQPKAPPQIPPPPAIPAEALEDQEPPLAADAFEPPSDVRSTLPSYRMSLEAGRALSDCVFNREESLDFTSELDEPFGRFVDAMGGSWRELSKLQDFDVWLGVTENLLQGLPADGGKRISAWYEVGYELAILHNLAGQGLFDSDERRVDAERQWRKALERFLIRAENARIPYEDLGRVLALLENLVAPRTERDLSNIGRSLDELRKQAAGADKHTTAA